VRQDLAGDVPDRHRGRPLPLDVFTVGPLAPPLVVQPEAGDHEIRMKGQRHLSKPLKAQSARVSGHAQVQHLESGVGLTFIQVSLQQLRVGRVLRYTQSIGAGSPRYRRCGTGTRASLVRVFRLWPATPGSGPRCASCDPGSGSGRKCRITRASNSHRSARMRGRDQRPPV
jgi:hypothetical protein